MWRLVVGWVRGVNHKGRPVHAAVWQYTEGSQPPKCRPYHSATRARRHQHLGPAGTAVDHRSSCVTWGRPWAHLVHACVERGLVRPCQAPHVRLRAHLQTSHGAGGQPRGGERDSAPVRRGRRGALGAGHRGHDLHRQDRPRHCTGLRRSCSSVSVPCAGITSDASVCLSTSLERRCGGFGLVGCWGWHGRTFGKRRLHCSAGLSSRTPPPPFLVNGSPPKEHQPPSANRCQPPPTATNRQLPTAKRQQPPTTNCQPPTAANRHQPSAANCRQPPPLK